MFPAEELVQAVWPGPGQDSITQAEDINYKVSKEQDMLNINFLVMLKLMK